MEDEIRGFVERYESLIEDYKEVLTIDETILIMSEITHLQSLIRDI